MAYDEGLADRIRRVVGAAAEVTERRMFGGLAFMWQGKIFVGVMKDDLMVRVGAEGHTQALSEPQVRPMDFTGRPMRGFVIVAAEGVGDLRSVRRWVDRSLVFVRAELARALEAPLPRARPAPSTKAPSTKAPSTKAPSTKAPSTKAPAKPRR